MNTRKRTRSSSGGVEPELSVKVEELSSATIKSIRADGISDYELERLTNIRRNESFLASLGLNSVKSALHQSAVARAPPKRKPVAVKKAPTNDGLLRRSGRVTFEKLQEEVALLVKSGDSESLASKQAELDALIVKRQEGSYQAVLEASASEGREWKRKDEGPLSMHELTYADDKYDCLLAITDLKSMLEELSMEGKSNVTYKQSHLSSIDQYSSSLQKLAVCEAEVAKLTESRITSVFVHPIAEKVVVFAGDKTGNLGVWDVSKLDSSDINGVYKYEPHSSNIARIDASPLEPTAVYSASYDGSVRLFDVEKEQFTLAFQAPDEAASVYFTDANFLLDQPKCMYVSTSDAYVALLDFRASNRAYQWKRECEIGYRPNSVQQHPTQPHLLVTSERSSIALYDVRKGASSSNKAKASGTLKALNMLQGHTHSVNAAYVSPDGQYLVSAGQDNTLRTWRNFTLPGQEADCIVTQHDNHTGRWLSTFRPSFDPKQPHAFALGCMQHPRRIEVFSPVSVRDEDAALPGVKKGVKRAMKDSGDGTYELRLLYNLQNEWLQSVCSRNAFHPSQNIVAGGNSSGRVHIFREKPESIADE